MGEVGSARIIEGDTGGAATMWVTHSIYDIWSPFDGLVPANSVGSSCVVTRIEADGTRNSWMFMLEDDGSYWSESNAIHCDETGVYVMAMGGPSPYSDATSGSILRKFDLNDNLVWSRFFPNPADYLTFGLDGGVIVIDGGASGGLNDSWAIDASDGSDIWHSVGFGFVEGGAIRGPDVNGSPTMWSLDFHDGEMYLALLTSTGFTEWPLGLGALSTLMPTTSRTVFYAHEVETVYRIVADGVSAPNVEGMDLNLSDYIGGEVSIAASMDPVTEYVYAHGPWDYSPADPIDVVALSTEGWALWFGPELEKQYDFNGIFGNARAHDGFYMQVGYWQTPGSPNDGDYGTAVTIFDALEGTILFGPYIYGDNETGGLLNGAFLTRAGGNELGPIGKGVGG